MSTLTICTMKIHNAGTVEVVWLSTIRVFTILDETGRIGRQGGYKTSGDAMLAAARIASNRYNDALLRSP